MDGWRNGQVWGGVCILGVERNWKEMGSESESEGGKVARGLWCKKREISGRVCGLGRVFWRVGEG